MLSKRGQTWLDFSALVLEHIENYAAKQYGDEGADIATDYSPEDALSPIKKYVARYGKNERPQEQARDFLKIAHYAQIAWHQWRRGIE